MILSKQANMYAFEMDLELLPDLVLRCVIEYLEKTDDILNLLKVFPDGKLENEARKAHGMWMFQKLFPFLVPYLSLEDALKCRLVCRRWQETVDNTMENVGLNEPDYSQTLETMANVHVRGNWTVCPFEIRYPWNWNEEELHRFMRDMEGYSGNPFPFRSVSFDNLYCWNPAFHASVKEFLERFGKHVWKLSVSIQLTGHQSTLLLRDLLQGTPNLRRLQLELNDATAPELPANKRWDIKRSLRDSEFPNLPHLRQLDYMLCRPFYKYGIPQYSPHLVHLDAPQEMEVAFMRAYERRLHGSFPSLKLLSVWVKNERQLRKLTQMDSPLKNLTIVCASRIPLSRHLDVYQHFARTLECITIEFDMENGEDTRRRLAYNYPQDFEGWQFPMLVTLSLENPSPLESLDVLAVIRPGLKTLHIISQLGDPDLLFEEMAGERVEIHGFLHRLYESAVWEEMPLLETLKVHVANPYGGLVEEEYTRAEQAEQENAL